MFAIFFYEFDETTSAISKVKNPENLNERKKVAHEGGGIAKTARDALEASLGQSVISPLNASNPLSLEIKKE